MNLRSDSPGLRWISKTPNPEGELLVAIQALWQERLVFILKVPVGPIARSELRRREDVKNYRIGWGETQKSRPCLLLCSDIGAETLVGSVQEGKCQVSSRIDGLLTKRDQDHRSFSEELDCRERLTRFDLNPSKRRLTTELETSS